MGTIHFVRTLPLVLVAACSSGGSSPCTANTAPTCQGTSLTFCANGSTKTVACKGPMGCMGNKCDSSTHTLGDGCFGA